MNDYRNPLTVLDQHQWEKTKKHILHPRRCTCGYAPRDMAAHQFDMLLASGYLIIERTSA